MAETSRTSRIAGPGLVNTPFGRQAAPRRHRLRVTAGLVGYERFRDFALVKVPAALPDGIWLMQSVEDITVGFPVLPLDRRQRYFERAELVEAANGLGVSPDDCRFLLIMVLRRNAAGLGYSAVLRAPIVLDPKRRIARQHVFDDDRQPYRRRVPATLVNGAGDPFGLTPIIGTGLASSLAGVNASPSVAKR
jgi:flagellar assembly factor FliW